MKVFIVLIFFISSSIANDSPPGLFSWFSASELSYAGGGSLLLAPTSRSINLAETTIDKSFSTSYIFYPAGIQAQSASLLLSINNKVIIGSINHISYGTFKGYDENAIQTDNYTSSDTWVRLGYTEPFKKLPLRFGMSNQVYFSKLENYKSTFLYSSFGLVWGIEKYKLEIGVMINDFLLIHNEIEKERESDPAERVMKSNSELGGRAITFKLQSQLTAKPNNKEKTSGEPKAVIG